MLNAAMGDACNDWAAARATLSSTIDTQMYGARPVHLRIGGKIANRRNIDAQEGYAEHGTLADFPG